MSRFFVSTEWILYVNIGPMTHAGHFFVEYLFIIENNV